MNKFQLAYIAAQAQHEQRKAEFAAFMKPFEHMMFSDIEDEMEAWGLIAEAAPSERETAEIMHAAGTALIEWALNKVDKIAHIGEEKTAIEIVRRQYRSNYTARQRVIEMALKLV